MGGQYLATRAHVVHLVKQAPCSKDEKFSRIAETKKPEGRSRVIDLLDQETPGTKERLEQIWTHKGGVAVHLWRVATFDGKGGKALVTLARQRISANIESGVRMRMRGDLRASKHGARWKWVELSSESARFNVRLLLSRNATAEDRAYEYPVTPDVEIAVDLHREARIAEAFATQRNSTRAIEYLHTKLFGLDLAALEPKLRNQTIRKVTFRDRDVRKIEKQLDLEPTEVRGDDAEGELGTVVMQGRLSGTRFKSLRQTAKAARQIESPNNDKRALSGTLIHDDGFEEYYTAQFYLSSTHPHVKFRDTTSRPAMRLVIDALLDTVGAK